MKSKLYLNSEGCLPQNLFSPFLNTLSHVTPSRKENVAIGKYTQCWHYFPVSFYKNKTNIGYMVTVTHGYAQINILNSKHCILLGHKNLNETSHTHKCGDFKGYMMRTNVTCSISQNELIPVYIRIGIILVLVCFSNFNFICDFCFLQRIIFFVKRN